MTGSKLGQIPDISVRVAERWLRRKRGSKNMSFEFFIKLRRKLKNCSGMTSEGIRVSGGWRSTFGTLFHYTGAE